MLEVVVAALFATFLLLAYIAWRRYLLASNQDPSDKPDTCPYSLTDKFDERTFVNVPHQKGATWLTEIFERSAKRFPDHIALQIPHTGEALTYADLNDKAERIADALSTFVTGPDQVVAVAMDQDNWQIVAAHLAILKAGGTAMFLDTTLPDALLDHMIYDANPVAVLTRVDQRVRDLTTINVLDLPQQSRKRCAPTWLDDPTERLATIFYTSGTTGMPKGVECPHAGYVNLALTYADYFDLIPGMDATSLTSSLGYDGSITEMYSAWVSGCTVVLLTKEQIRSGPDLVPILCDSEVTVLFCPPVLLTTMTSSPEIDLPYPICRYIVPAGEAFPNALVEPWTRARRQIINTYGPTEASTDTSRQALRPGEPVTIGSPFPNVTYVILDVGTDTPLSHGDAGELCIGGVHLSRGYRNLPQQTAEKFVEHAKFGRLYRTGDKCMIDPETHRVHFLGRIDTQLKVRGHRVEAQAVEDMLQSQFAEIDAAVLDYQNEELVAFVSAPSVTDSPISVAAPAPARWSADVIAHLQKHLPETSVPSRIFVVEAFVMKPVSGKIDRRALPDLSQLIDSPKGGKPPVDIKSGGNELQPADLTRAPIDEILPDADPNAAEVLRICRDVFEAPVDWDSAFVKSGGHSINIARLAQRLQVAGWPVSVRSLLTEHNSPRKIAHLTRGPVKSTTDKVSAKVPTRIHVSDRDHDAAKILPLPLFTALQIAFTFALSAPAFIAFLSVFGFLEIGTFFTTAGLFAFVVVGASLYAIGLVVPFLLLIWALLIKFLCFGGFYKTHTVPGVYPKWSVMHLRIWCLNRLQNMVLMPLGTIYRSAPLMAFALRQLGARTGRNLQCAKDANFYGPLDQLTIEDDVAIQTGAYIHSARWSGEGIHVGPITLQSGCKIGMRAGVGNDVTVGEGAWITPFTPALEDIDPHHLYEGAPARATGRVTRLERTARHCQYAQPVWFLESANVAMQIALNLLLTVLPTAVILWGMRHLIPAGEAELSGASFTSFVTEEQRTTATESTEIAASYFLVTPIVEIFWQLSLYAIATGWLAIMVTSLLGSLFMRLTPAAPGLYGSRGLGASLLMYRLAVINGIQTIWTWTITGQYLRALAGLRFPRLGASECDILFNLVPEVTFPDSQIFWSNGSFTNVLDYGAEHIALRRIAMPRNFFSGNNCVAEHGNYPDNFLLGVSTPCSDTLYRQQLRTRAGLPITVAGNPPLEFASASFEEENKRQKLPGFPLFLGRVCLNDVFSIAVLRIVEGLVFTLLYVCLQRNGVDSINSAILALILAEAGLIGLSVTVKQTLVGNSWGKDDQTPFWSWRHFTYFFAQDCFFIWCRGPLGLFSGTILSNPILRLFGCHLGKRTLVLEPMQCSDWNAVHFGHDGVVGGFLQLHTFENMTLKVKETRLGDGCTVAFGTTVMSGAQISNAVTLQPLSMALKEVSLAEGTYVGSPAELANDHEKSKNISIGDHIGEQESLPPKDMRPAVTAET